jgi:hypothetical protein
MGKIKKPILVKFFTGFIFRDENDLNIAIERLTEKLGPADIFSGIIPFDFTDYYKNEMGEKLFRCFISFEKLQDPSILPDIKIFTNNFEEEMGKEIEGEIHRGINLDPGYLAQEKIVLASTKNFRHRIYLRDGIYGEVTLYWQKGAFHEFDYTFPDYRTEFYKDYFRKVREKYRLQLGFEK